MKTRVTQSDIARAVGLHNTTVSLALRNSRLIPQATRDRIQSMAKTMGYAPDPALRALVAYRNSQKHRRQLQTFVYITSGESRKSQKNPSTQERQYAAAQRRAGELGYQLEHVWLGRMGMNQRQLDRTLLHRGISGVLIASQGMSVEDLSGLTWSRLSALEIGYGTPVSALNQITTNPAAIMRLAMQHILAGGSNRLGLAIPRIWDELTDQAWSAAFHAELYRCGIKESLPVLYLPSSPAELSMASWYEQHRPEVIIGLTSAVHRHIRKCRLRIPRDVAYVDLFLQKADGYIAGVWQNPEKLGELAVEMLVNQFEKNVFGLPSVRTVTSIGGLWRSGASLPSKTLFVGELEAAEPSAVNCNLVA